MRINLNIPDELVKTIDEKAKSLNLNRTAYIVMTLSTYFKQEKAMDSISDMDKLIKEIKKLKEDLGKEEDK
jgi:isochorismate hydrolase